MKPGADDKRVFILIQGEELEMLQNESWQMADAFGLDRRIDNYQGKRPIGLYQWDLECLLAVLDEETLTKAPCLTGLHARLQAAYDSTFTDGVGAAS